MFWTELRNQAAFATGQFSRLFGRMEVPSLPQVAVRLLQMSREEDADFGDVANLVAGDAGLASKVLKTVNSAFMGLSNQVTDIRHAVSILGLRRMHSLALSFSVAGVLPKTARGFDPEPFWRDSIQRAVFAEALAKETVPGSEGEAFGGGLLQNLALPILLNQWGKYYLPVMEEADKSGRPLQQVEDEEFSWNHAQAGAWMVRNWGFPDVLVCCIGLHHATIEELESLDLAKTPVTAAAVSSRLPDAGEICRAQFNMSADRYQRLCRTTDAACEEFAVLFDVEKPDPLVNPG